MFKHILLATDFSPSAMWAADAARSLAEAFDAKLSLLHVYDPERAVEGEGPAGYLQVLRDDRFAGLDAVVLSAVAHPRADEAICGEAITVKPDLIVAGRHGQHSLRERLLGSTTERVVRHAPCSVLVVHPATRDHLVSFKHILAASDLSDASEPAIAAAGAMAKALKAGVTLTHVFDFPSLGIMREPYDDHPDHSFRAMMNDKLETMRKIHLDPLSSSVRVLRDKSTVSAICDFAGDYEVDLITVGTHGRTGVSRLLIGSVAERVVRHAPCSVMVMRST